MALRLLCSLTYEAWFYIRIFSYEKGCLWYEYVCFYPLRHPTQTQWGHSAWPTVRPHGDNCFMSCCSYDDSKWNLQLLKQIAILDLLTIYEWYRQPVLYWPQRNASLLPRQSVCVVVREREREYLNFGHELFNTVMTLVCDYSHATSLEWVAGTGTGYRCENFERIIQFI